MALIKCPECGKEISDKATNCIHCGYPLSLLSSEKADRENKEYSFKIGVFITVCNGY